MTDGIIIVCFTHFMQDIRESLRQASKQVSAESLDEAIQILEQVAIESKNQDNVGGIFCAYKHLGDLYYKMVSLLLIVTCRDETKIL